MVTVMVGIMVDVIVLIKVVTRYLCSTLVVIFTHYMLSYFNLGFRRSYRLVFKKIGVAHAKQRLKTTTKTS